MNEIVLCIYYTNNELYEKQLEYLESFNIPILSFNNNIIDYYKNILDIKGYKWAICIDETMFINDATKLLDLIHMMEKDNIQICGVPDGGIYTIRNGSPYIFNHSFFILNIDKVDINNNILNTSIKKWEEKDIDIKIKECNDIGKKNEISYNCRLELNVTFDNYYPIMIELMKKYNCYYLKPKNTLDHPFKKCPPIKIYNDINEVIGIYCGYGCYYNQNNIKIDIGINNIVSIDNNSRINYFLEKINQDLLTKLSIKYNCKKYYYYNFINLYKKWFKLYKNENKILSIGIYEHNSHIDVLRDYFKKSEILSIDKNKDIVKNIDNSLHCDTACESSINYNICNNEYNIIIDNGISHPWEQLYLLSILFKKLKSGGIYICENIHIVNNIGKWGNLDNSIKITNMDIINQMYNNDKYNRPFYINNENYDYLINNINKIDYLDNTVKCIKCIKCNEFGEKCKCNIINDKMVCVIQKK
tara:strand:- start:613 stop:2031 length:1419 start_codon:yes stop_codon:yes gene_type:complete